MRKLLFALLAASLLIACNNDKNKDGSESKSATEKTNETSAPVKESNLAALQAASKPYEKMLGSFVGAFGDNRITMLITTIAADSVVGRTIVGGNDRPFKGTFSKNGTVFSFDAKEPGDHKDDGVFKFTIDETKPDMVAGTWKANDTKRSAKEYSLNRRKFEYKADAGTFPEASQRLLKADDVDNMMKEDLEFMRNEIFARHGFCFSSKSLRQRFEMEDWYIPNTVDIKGFLTDIEKKNIELIKRYEKYADEYGDEYGR
ncbi:MAG: YARHG domain-containing protein [Chitinophagaceae bacterium]|nr:YARHG domain-containing protein [Chitinophagaceae bacterium]